MRGLKFWSYKQPGIQELRDLDAYMAAIARGLVPGAYLLNAYGRRVLAGAQPTPYTVWPGPTALQPYDRAGVSGVIVSTSLQDAPGLGGVSTIHVHYIDTNGDLAEYATPMAGLVPVPIPDFRFIECLHRIDGGAAAGDISVISTAPYAGTVFSILPTGRVRCPSSARVVPRGKTLFIRNLVGGAASGTAASIVEMRLMSSEIDTHKAYDSGFNFPHNGIMLQDASQALPINGVFPVSSEQLVYYDVNSDKGAIVTASFTGWVEDASDALEIV